MWGVYFWPVGLLFCLSSGLTSSFPFVGSWFILSSLWVNSLLGFIPGLFALGFVVHWCLFSWVPAWYIQSLLWVFSWFSLGSFWVCSRSLLNWDLLAASLTYCSFDLGLLFTVFNSGPTCLNSLFARSGFSEGFTLVCSGFALHLELLTLPEHIYNSHYGNGVPAMFTS